MPQFADATVLEILTGIAEDLRRLRSKCIAVSASADVTGEMADSAQQRLFHLTALLFEPQDVAHVKMGGVAGRTDVAPSHVARHLEVQTMPDDSYRVQIDFSKNWIRLSPLLGALLLYLAQAPPDDGEDISGWLSKQAIHAWLEQRNARVYRPQFVHNLVYNLRRRLGGHAFLLHSSRARGFRFALKQASAVEHELRTRRAGASARHSSRRRIEGRGVVGLGKTGREASLSG